MSVTRYDIRRASVQDLDIVLRHRRRMFEDMGFTDLKALDTMIAVSKPLIGDGLKDGSYAGWLVEAPDHEVVSGAGVISLKFQPHPVDPRAKRAWVVNMFTEPEHRRRGLARRLMTTIIEWCRQEGMRVLYLHASDEGRALYASLGFRPTNEMRLDLLLDRSRPLP